MVSAPAPSHSVTISVFCTIALVVGVVAFIKSSIQEHEYNEADSIGARSLDEQQRRQRGLGQDKWWPVFGSIYNDGYCTDTGTHLHGSSPLYTTMESCCTSNFPNQGSNRCMPIVDDSPPVPEQPNTPPPAPTNDPSTPPNRNIEDDLDLSVPDNCQNLPKYENGTPIANEDWVMPADSIWVDNPFSGKTCNDLALDIATDQPEDVKKFCKFLSQGIYSGPCAIEACCFCGGGDHILKPRCENMEWNSIKDTSGSALNCEFVDALPADKQGNFCENYGEASFSVDFLTLGESCCACGGGRIHYNQVFAAEEESLQSRRKLQDDHGTAAAALLPDGNHKIDYTYRVGAGDSPGIANLEYLGLGYDMIRGNPRGSDTSELDPGFRYRILQLQQAQTALTVDQEYMVPFGTAVKYTSSCKYDSSSVEISSESDLRRSLSNEAVFQSSSTSTTQASANNLFFKASGSMSKSHSFSLSTKFESQSSTNSKTKSVSFEARAICSEIEASFIPGLDYKLSPEFQKALNGLPVPYNSDNKRHNGAWSQFFNNFGTNYVKYLILGGKRIESTSMTQQDYSSLVSQSVDVASTMSFEMSAAMGASASVKAGHIKGLANLATKFGGPKGAAIGSVVNVALAGTDDNESVLGAEISKSSSSSLANFASNTAQANSAFEISKKKLSTQEYTIGGLPFDDWREWAASVAEKPMPIKYELGSLMDLMSFEQSMAFIAAVQDNYGIDLSEEIKGPILKGTSRHGVYSGTGDPLSLSTNDPNNDSRVLMQNDVTAVDGSRSSVPLYASNSTSTSPGGICLDAAGRDFSYVSYFLDLSEKGHVEACIEKCSTLSGTEDQVGVGAGLKNQTPLKYACRCYYDAGNLPRTEDNLFPKSGVGPVDGSRAGLGLDEFCIRNLAFSSRAGIFTYSDIWKGKTNKPIALFATPIRGSIALNSAEELAPPFSSSTDKVVDPWNNDIYFMLTEDINSNGVLGLTNFGTLRSTFVSNDMLPNFSFLSVDALKLHASDFLSGVVAYNGLIQNEDGRTSFDVEMSSSGFSINFKGHVYDSVPTVLAFPNWLGTKEEYYPQVIQDLALSISEINPSGFKIRYGTQQTPKKSYRGFNFLVIGPNMDQANIKHGLIHDGNSLHGGTSSTYGMTVVPESDCSPPSKVGDNHCGVKIQFDSEFSDIPSVIVTPAESWWSGIPKCIVESITTLYVRVKCGLVDEDTDNLAESAYTPISFTIVVVGNAL